eukprot:CAMPEP_0173391956 /NCGR_PEP_ID=MMETSP1356-20130122/18682_1 /TAXON_ID=77927 ORGANISM="Hemiselmis virescens, Strain PCC157" /NCGR_SAMPLE_ID=MMETSP1356 /ASSEMBLY_ACC=CAM_ASM_000847 /LENGTH=97 /DNA_ID=CAMNT_0014349663 /DNA_START=52 /DNA_END=341 /DNA_ORIENTATION=-
MSDPDPRHRGEYTVGYPKYTVGQFFRSKQGWMYMSWLVVLPGIAFATRSLWCGEVTDPKELPKRYEYAKETADKNKQQLQLLLNRAKEGKMGGHWEG